MLARHIDYWILFQVAAVCGMQLPICALRGETASRQGDVHCDDRDPGRATHDGVFSCRLALCGPSDRQSCAVEGAGTHALHLSRLQQDVQILLLPMHAGDGDDQGPGPPGASASQYSHVHILSVSVLISSLSCSVKHSQELDGKSTAIHAKLLAPSRVFIHQFDRTTASTDGDLVQMIAADPTGFVILFPDASAVGLEELSAEDLSRVHSGIFIDGTWSQATAISRLEPYSSLRRVRINPTLTTVFWRYQNLGVHCLATIEAIYYFVREYAALRADASGHDHDNLLYFYSFFYHLIQRTYRDNPTRQYTTKHRANYIA